MLANACYQDVSGQEVAGDLNQAPRAPCSEGSCTEEATGGSPSPVAGRYEMTDVLWKCGPNYVCITKGT